MPRRTFYYKPAKAPPKVDPRLAGQIKALIHRHPSFDYSAVACLLGLNKNTVRRIFQLKGWQVKTLSTGTKPRADAWPSAASAPNEHWATDLANVQTVKDGKLTLALVVDCHTRELVGWHLSRSAKASTPVAALEQALIARFGKIGPVGKPLQLRSDNGAVFKSRQFKALARRYGLGQEFIMPYCPQQNGKVEQLIRTLKEQCLHGRSK